MIERPTAQSIFIQTAKLFASRSTCLRKHVGAILVKNGRIISTGYNGVPSRMEHCGNYFYNIFSKNNYGFKTFDDFINSKIFYDMHHKEYSKYENHAEINCIAYAAQNGVSIKGSEIYITLSPCLDCAKAIVASGITGAFYSELYDRDTEGINFLNRNQIKNQIIN